MPPCLVPSNTRAAVVDAGQAILPSDMPWYASRYAGAASMNFTIEFFRVRSIDDSHATLDRISVAADNLEAAKVKAKSLFETLDMPQKPDGQRILVQEERELFVWSRGDDDA
jgi:hypothetical protein